MRASPAVNPSISTPRYANITIGNASTTPGHPFGRNPPCAHRFDTPVGTPPLPTPATIISAPPAIISTIVTILISANQNSNSPYSLTAMKFTAPITISAANVQIQFGTSGNHICM